MSRLPRLSALAAVGVLLAGFPTQDAHADACTISRSLINNQFAATSFPGTWSVPGSWLGGPGTWFGSDTYPACGVSGDYSENQDVWQLVCDEDTEVRITVQPRDCPLDLFLLRNGCDGGPGGDCAGSSTYGSTSMDFITFDCDSDSIYYLAIERPDGDLLSDFCAFFLDAWLDVCPCTAADDFPYTLDVEYTENCENDYDDDADGLEDCLDPDCPTCVEICDNEEDDDYDGLVDCADPDCFGSGECCDQDGDGAWAIGGTCGGDDCNDADQYIFPGAVEEPADAVDQDCDGYELCFIDDDGDSFGVPLTDLSTSFTCFAPGFSPNPDDCDDTDPLVNPDAPERIGNGQDDNCDGEELCYVDLDMDTYRGLGTTLTSEIDCTGGGLALESQPAGDCDDTNPQINPGATEIPLSGFDENCDGFELCYVDDDGDDYGTDSVPLVPSTVFSCFGSGTAPVDGDCDDTNPAIFPSAQELPADLIDQNCDTFELCYLDEDRDTFGNDRGRTTQSPALDCSNPGASLLATDCNDRDDTVYPGAPDPQGDGIDQDCDGLQDCFVDDDGDGYGDPSRIIPSGAPGCIGVGIAPTGGDCDDSDPGVNPAATEVPLDGFDQDCDGLELCWQDLDLDTWGSDQLTPIADFTCLASGVAPRSGDCDDSAPGVNPAAFEIALDGIDQDCDGFEECYVDADGDGYGGAPGTLTESTSFTCSVSGVSLRNDDCDDSLFRVNPGATEILADGIDQDCDGDEGCYRDSDFDTYGGVDVVFHPDLTCSDQTGAYGPYGLSRRNDDCDDTNPLAYPGAPLPPSPVPGVDYSCGDEFPCYRDNDLDSFGAGPIVTLTDPSCGAPGFSVFGNDCNDADDTVYPGAVDQPLDGFDDDCDGFEECYRDADQDGYGDDAGVFQATTDLTCTAPGVSLSADDCDDGDPFVNPGAIEIPADGVDQTCDGREICYRDNDQDTFGSTTETLRADLDCVGPGYADNDDDCNDSRFDINPMATDRAGDQIDQDCDGVDSCFQDLDDDTYGSSIVVPGVGGTPALGDDCVPSGFSPRGGDCADDDPQTYPGAPEIPGDGRDQDCNGEELCFRDSDGDQYGSTQQLASTDFSCRDIGLSPFDSDCDDSDPLRSPGATEVPADGFDADCDEMEDCYEDKDDDRYGVPVIVPSPRLDCFAAGVSDRDDDCNDFSADVYPGAPEILGDGIDQDCNGEEICYEDADRDGYGGTTQVLSPITDCRAPGLAPNSDDCDDTDPLINPEGVETPADGIDGDCDGWEACFIDEDVDGFGRGSTTLSRSFICAGTGIADNDDDCDDFLPDGDSIYPGAPEIVGDGIDQDCDGLETCWIDGDQDTYGGTGTDLSASFDCVDVGLTAQGGDCDDVDPLIFPGAEETVGDGIDQDCDGVDHCWFDRDRDGYGSDQAIPGTDLACSGATETTVPGDCRDSGALLGVSPEDIHPGAPEVCNDVDDDCNGLIDDDDPAVDASPFAWYEDMDGDGYGYTDQILVPGGPPPAHPIVYACDAPDDYVSTPGDCDDLDEDINPGAQEVCDPYGIDEDCDGRANEMDVLDPSTGELDAEGAVWVWRDADGDDYGAFGSGIHVCTIPAGWVENEDDCDDTNPLVHLYMDEILYDGFDNDCDPSTLDDDLDGDGYGIATDCNDNPATGGFDVNPGRSETAGDALRGVDDDCNGLVDDTTDWYDDDGDGFTEVTGDCDDDDDTRYPAAPETYDGEDDDCDGIVDEGTIGYDDDGDGYSEEDGDCHDGDPAVHPGAVEIMDDGIDNDCDSTVDGGIYDPDADGYTEDPGGDCDEGDPTVYPGAPELPDEKDNDCDGEVDEGTERFDDDGDGYSEQGGDCNDLDPEVNPAAVEVPDGIDNDCDGLIDEATDNSDDDGDGYSEVERDCDDTNPDIYPGAPEVLNDIDDDCDGEIDEDFFDVDEDGWTVEQGDCDDLNGWANPGRIEVCDGIDNDCDGAIDNSVDCGADTGPGGEYEETGCEGCSSNGSPRGMLFLFPTALALLGLRRRRADAA